MLAWARNVGKFGGSKRLPLVYAGSTPLIDTDSCSAVVDDLSTREQKYGVNTMNTSTRLKETEKW